MNVLIDTSVWVGHFKRRSLYGRGCGLVDISLLVSALLSEKTLRWTADKRWERLAVELHCSYRPVLHS